jgi:2-polyprenyl-3-methyl-5-hydroxy-6-metoxy-1,4-benzoquinol methylase
LVRFDPEVLPYLHGESFSNGLCLRVASRETSILNRLAVLDSLLKNKRVVHVGCCDHVPLIKKKLAENTWLHARLCRVATSCYGVDTSDDGIKLMQDELGYENLSRADIVHDQIPEIEMQQWDYMLLGELLEHLEDPVEFVTAIRQRYAKNVARVIITVPNALSLLNARFAFHNQECINTDHRHLFSPYTLARALISAGMIPEEFFFCEPFPADQPWYRRPTPRALVIDMLLRRYPALREGLIMIARI